MGIAETSDRAWKDAYHGSHRAQERLAIHHDRDPLPLRAVSDVWDSDKDGKRRITDPRWMRK